MLVILTVLIIVHECGHFSVARFFGFQTPIFGFGLPLFGPYWTIGRKWGTEFRIHALLIGGYVAIPELGDESGSSKEMSEDSGYAVIKLKPFRKFPIWQRALVAFAGVGFNIIFAYFVMIGMLAILGEPMQPVFVHSLIKETPIAAKAGVLAGDQIISINNEYVSSPADAVKMIVNHKNEEVKVCVKRRPEALENLKKSEDNAEVDQNEDQKNESSSAEIQNASTLVFSMTTSPSGKVGMALVGKGPVTYRHLEKRDGNIFLLAGKKLWFLTCSMVDALGQMVAGLGANMFHGGKNASGQDVPGFQDIHGVLAVIKIGADVAQRDWSQLFLFTILISLDLAIINLLPWPGLDGSHLAFMAVEAVRGKPMNERAQGEIVKWGFVSLLLLMALVTYNDVSALVTGKLDVKQSKKVKAELKKTEPPAEPLPEPSH